MGWKASIYKILSGDVTLKKTVLLSWFIYTMFCDCSVENDNQDGEFYHDYYT